jgi:cytochrome c-type biogenesis protein CcmH
VVTRIDELAAATNFDLGGRLDPFRAAVAAAQAAAPMPTAGLPAGAAMGDAAAAPGLATPDAANPGPTAADVAAASQMTPEDRQTMILGMLEKLHGRLLENPDDPEGWVKLIKSRLVMNDAAGAAGAYKEAQAALAAKPETLATITEAARAAGVATE